MIDMTSTRLFQYVNQKASGRSLKKQKQRQTNIYIFDWREILAREILYYIFV